MPQRNIPNMELHRGSGEWSALYVDGRLAVVGDHYLADEKIRQLCGIEVVDSDDFLRGGDGGRTGPRPAQTVAEIHEYATQRLVAAERSKRLREQAAALLAEAEQLEGKKTR